MKEELKYYAGMSAMIIVVIAMIATTVLLLINWDVKSAFVAFATLVIGIMTNIVASDMCGDEDEEDEEETENEEDDKDEP